MRLVKRTDGVMLNLDAVLFFTPMKFSNMVVEMPGEQFYIIYNFALYNLNTDDSLFEKEFEGWPKT